MRSIRTIHTILLASIASLVLLVGCGTPTPAQPTYNESVGKSISSPLDSLSEQAGQASEVHDESLSTPTNPADMPAGATLSEDEIEAAGGAEQFFWVEEISDAVFERMDGLSYGPDCTVPVDDLRYVRVLHADAEGLIHVGELVVNRRVADEVKDIFFELYNARYPIRKMHLVDDYDAEDTASCLDDNTSSFNYRLIANTSTLSNHSYGLAIDINTYENPYYIVSTGYLWPPDGARYLDRSLDEPYMIHPGDLCYQLFMEHGWTWGGHWNDPKDYQHFEKPQALYE